MFLDDNISAMRDYLNLISTPKPEDTITLLQRSGSQEHTHDHELGKLIARQERVPGNIVEREASGFLPFLIDVPKNIALIASGIAEHCKKLNRESFDKRGVTLSAESLQRLANLSWQALLIRDRTLLHLEQHPDVQYSQKAENGMHINTPKDIDNLGLDQSRCVACVTQKWR